MKLIDLLHLLDALYDREEFHMLCFTLGVDHEDFETRGKDNQIRELLTFLRRRKRLLELVEVVSQERPYGHADWDSVRQTVLLLQEQSQTDPSGSADPDHPARAKVAQGFLGRQLGHYHLVEKLGEGGMAEVYKGYRADLDQFAAIKVMHSFLTAQETAVARFRREAKVLSSLDHPHIIRLFEFERYASNAYYLVMEYIQGPTLKSYLEQVIQAGQPLDLAEAVTIILQIADALAYAHGQGIIHRDIKPANIMLTDGGRAILTDFGIVKLLGGQASSVYTATGAMMGTPAYLPPEQALGGQGDARADIYSLGVMLFYMTTGRLPFVADAPMAVVMKHISESVPLPEQYNPAIPFRLQEVILRALAKDPDGRYPTMTAMIDALKLVQLDGQALPDITSFTQLPSAIPAGDWTDPADWRDDVLPPPFHVPPPIPYFAGRSRAVETLAAQLTSDEGSAIVGVVGFGGVGKTALAIQTARQLREAFPDGILWAQLDTSTIEAELTSFANAYGQAETLTKLPDLTNKAEFVRDMLADKKVLVVLDQASDPEQVKHLLPSGAKNKTLITTRNSKLLTNLNANIIPLQAMTTDEGLALLSEMVGAQRVAADIASARQIVHNTGGLPLALSIAAGFLNEATDLTLSEYAELLQDEQGRLEHLTDWSDTARNVSASFELSYQNLPPPLQKLFAALSIFDGPDFDSHAVATILKLPVAQVKLGLGRLFFLSLIGSGLGEREQLFPIEADGNGRYRLNPLLKLFARKKLGDETDELRQRALTYYLDLAEQNQQVANFHRLDLEWHNLIALLDWAHKNQQQAEYRRGVLALTHWQMGTLGFLGMRGQWSQARRLLQTAVTDQPNLTDTASLDVTLRLAILAARQSDYATANQTVTQIEDHLATLSAAPTAAQQANLAYLHYLLAHEASGQVRLEHLQRGVQALLADKSSTASAEKGYLFTRVASTLYRLGNFADCITAARQAIAFLVNDTSSVAINAHQFLSLAHRDLGNLAESRRYLDTALEIAKHMQDIRLLASLWMNKGVLEDLQGQWADSVASQEEALRLFRYMGNYREESGCLLNLGLLTFRLGRDEEAAAHLRQALSLAQNHQVPEFAALSHCYLAILHTRQAHYNQARQALRQAHQLTQQLQLGYLWPAVYYLEAELGLAINQPARALKLAQKAITAAQTSRYQVEEGIAWRVQGQVHLALGQLSEAIQAYETSLTKLQGQDTYEYARTQLALAHLQLTNRPTTATQQLLEESSTTFAMLGAEPDQQQAQQALAQLRDSAA